MIYNTIVNNELTLIEITQESLKDKIYIIRGQKVMLDFELAGLYGYETRYFNRQVKNNIDRFPDDFIFQLNRDEWNSILKCKNFTSSWGGKRKLPFAFTEQGIYMLTSVLNGDLAIKQSISLIRLFKAMKDYIVENNLVGLTSNQYIENKFSSYDKRFEIIENKLETVMDNFIDPSMYKDFLIFDGEKIEFDVAFKELFSLANKTIYLVDDYIGLKTLELLKYCKQNINIIIFSDNVARPKLSLSFVNDFKNDRPDINISFKKTNNRIHDRYIAIDIDGYFRLFHSGASSKDGGNKITTIMEIEEPLIYRELFDKLLQNDEMIIV